MTMPFANVTWLKDPPFNDLKKWSWQLKSSEVPHPDRTLHTYSSRASRGAEVSEEKNYNYIAKKEFAYRMRARRPTSATPKPFLCCERAFCCSMVVMWPVLMSWSCLRREMKSCGWLWGDVGWATVVSCDVACHVIWCGWHVIWCDVIACVVSCHVMQCDVMVMTCYLFLPCNGMECCELKMPLVVRPRCVVRSGSVTMWWSKQLFCTTKYYCSTTLYYKVLVQYYSAKY